MLITSSRRTNNLSKVGKSLELKESSWKRLEKDSLARKMFMNTWSGELIIFFILYFYFN